METCAVRVPPRPASTARMLLELGRTLGRVVCGYFLLIALTTAVHFPYHTDAPVAPSISGEARKFYREIYQESAASGTNGSNYVQIARETIEGVSVVPALQQFVEDYDLRGKRVLDVGAGTGYLQDLVSGYVGLDISPTARRFFHKPFIEASATDMPIRTGEFDAVWSIWVLEHVPNPEQALVEIRRVVKDGGLLFLAPAWNCVPWAADGYAVRPYRDFGFTGKLIKASIPIRSSPFYITTYMLPIRLLRAAYASLFNEPTRLHYYLLKPNFEHYWVGDSDAMNSLDYHEMLLWFTSRGDECLNCGPHPSLDTRVLVIRVHKQKSR